MIRFVLSLLGIALLVPTIAAQEPPIEFSFREPLQQEILRNATTPGLTGRGIRQAAATGDIELAAALIDSLSGTATDAGLADAGDAIGSLWLLRLRTNEALTDEQRETIGRMQQAVRARADDPAEIDRNIAQLTSGKPDERVDAIKTLRSSGELAIARLVSSLITSPDPPPAAHVEMLGRFGEEAAAAVEAAFLFAPPASQAKLLTLLARLSPSRAIPSAVAVAHNPASDADARRVAEAILNQQVGGVPNRSESVTFLASQLDTTLANLQQTARGSLPTETIWFVTEDADAIDFRPATRFVALANTGFQQAELVRRVAAQNLDAVRLAVAAEILYRFAADPLFGTEADLAALNDRWQASGGVGADRLLLLLDHSMPQTAQLAAIRLLAATGRRDLVHTAGPEPTPLVEIAIDGPSSVMRYEAAAAIADLDPRRPFTGASQVAELWEEIMSAPARPQAMVVENLASARSRAVNWIQELGYDVLAAGNGRTAIRAFASQPGIELVLIGPDPVDYSVVELLDRLRRRPGGPDLPILLYNQSPATAPRDRWNGPYLAVSQLTSSQDLRAQVNRLLAMLPVEPLGLGDLSFIQRRVDAMLQRIADEPTRYPAFIAAEQSGTIAAPSEAPTP